METVLEKKPQLDDGTINKTPKKHIVKRVDNNGGRLTDIALCGALWDIAELNQASPGKMCDECVRIYKEMHPGWPIPG